MKYAVVIPAAGQGKRMQAGFNKQFLMLEKKPVIIHTVSVFAHDPWCERIVVVANENEIEDMKQLIQDWKIPNDIDVVPGGSERQDSVMEGLRHISAAEIVLIHDGARPFIRPLHIHKLVEKAQHQGAAVLGVKIKDTMKRVKDHLVLETIDRSYVWSVQTPQAFQFPVIYDAYKKAQEEGFRGTDDTSLVERTGFPVHIIEGDYNNIKLTTPEDITIAQAILKKQTEED
ncbi:2-C-methyl-D-erythritol 4-phosphate cytidylyltransferase [Alteribacillus persepolensis]|uniref:2-C-methyl-D-erythritol 4-phosphate cytidylyltransferase n=1 Tax=Alteribacillus persepolensis TaxID=568899 RepID=A0A1G8HHT3_9BACI|nr:2-C-methyl-D-erythritol 4-phosphate cytidylyltransferase [Alteribacillus persepolensis]SDI06155.1 2-C-methyl-D-erythritol 4-phosphate cytidylyltransferase [Alteribacillus persepolensis]